MLVKELIKQLSNSNPNARVDLTIDDLSGNEVYCTSKFELCHADGSDGYIELVTIINK